MNQETKAIQQAKTLFQSRCNGVLSTQSVDLEGYPFGSITPYCFDDKGRPVILISTIAQHTRNIDANHKVSLLSHDCIESDVQAAARVTYVGNATRIDDNAAAERYYRFYPQSKGFHKTHDFHFYVIDCVRVRYIGGFGEIYWIDSHDFLSDNPFSSEEERHIIEHMNSDHQDALNHYCALFSLPYDSEHLPTLVGIDRDGCHLRIKDHLARITFDAPINNPMEARTTLVELARRPI